MREVTVLVSDLDRFDEVMKHARRLGMRMNKGGALRESGVIVGTIAAEKIDDLRAVDGVEAGEGSRTYQIPPPDEELQ